MLPIIRSLLKTLAWLGFFAGTVLIVSNSFLDYRPGGGKIFITQRDPATVDSLWLFSLYTHVLAGCICLVASLPQLSGGLLRRFPAIHRICGRIYAIGILLIVSPTGLHLAFFAKGGLLGQGGFFLLGVVTFFTTLFGITTIRNGDRVAHRRWMIRSFAMVATAISFRVYHVLFFYAGLSIESNYVVSLWLSILGNAAVAELVIKRRKALLSNQTPILMTS
ncbi:MAG: DUF2306 domain-containing protein [Luteolibacter sp.]